MIDFEGPLKSIYETMQFEKMFYHNRTEKIIGQKFSIKIFVEICERIQTNFFN